MGVLAIFSTGTYAIIGTTCVKSETCYKKYHKKTVFEFDKFYNGIFIFYCTTEGLPGSLVDKLAFALFILLSQDFSLAKIWKMEWVMGRMAILGQIVENIFCNHLVACLSWFLNIVQGDP